MYTRRVKMLFRQYIYIYIVYSFVLLLLVSFVNGSAVPSGVCVFTCSTVLNPSGFITSVASFSGLPFPILSRHVFLPVYVRAVSCAASVGSMDEGFHTQIVRS